MKTYHVLFIGNSHTYLHYMPDMVERLAESKGQRIEARQVTGEGASLQWHWENRATRNLIKDKNWDYVVLQERSGGPLKAKASLIEHAKLLDEEIKKQGAKTVFFMTWANKQKPESQKALADAYMQITLELDAMIAPVGLAWDRALQEDPGLDLHHKDGRHANPVGSYLAACVFFATLTSLRPEGLPGTLFVGGKNRVGLTEEKARFLQKMAFESVHDFVTT